MAGNRPRRRNKSPLATRIFFLLVLVVVLSMVLAAVAPLFAR
jgi:hypothetical protein